MTFRPIATNVGGAGRIIMPDGFSHHTGLTMLQIFQLKRTYPQTMNFRGLPWDWFDWWKVKFMVNDKKKVVENFCDKIKQIWWMT